MLDPAIADYLGTPVPPPPLNEASIDGLRAAMLAASSTLDAPEIASVTEFDVSGVGTRLYRPFAQEPLALLVFLHGGGWFLGNLDTHDAMCRIIASRTNCAVLAVDYRLAPEHPFPAALEDVETVWTWVLERAEEMGWDAETVAIGGESAGANLAASLTLRLRDQGDQQPAFQFLVHPPTNLNFTLPSFDEVAAPGLDRDYLAQCVALYVDGADVADPLISPLRAQSLGGLPPAIVLTAEVDPFRDDGEYYAHALAASGVETVCRRLPGLPHGFMFLPTTIPAVSSAFDAMADLLRRYFAVR